MKFGKKLASLLLALIIVLSLAAPALAADEPQTQTHSITINGTDSLTVNGRKFNAYKIFDLKVIEGKDLDSDPSNDKDSDEDPANDKENDYVYTVNPTWKSFLAEYFEIPEETLDFDAQIRNQLAVMLSIGGTVEETENDLPDADARLYAFGRAALAYAKDSKNGIAVDAQATGENNKAVFENLPMGYYLVEDATNPNEGVNGDYKIVSAVMMRSTDQDVNITIKASLTTVDKVIVDGRNYDAQGVQQDRYTNGGIGDCVQFKLSSNVPDVHGFTNYTFKFNDTLSAGLTYDEVAKTEGADHVVTYAAAPKHNDTYFNSKGEEQTIDHVHMMEVKVGDRTLKQVTGSYVPVDDETDTARYDVYILEGETGRNLTVSFPHLLEAVQKGYWTEGEDVTVTYYAWINENANIVKLTNPNTVTLTYSNNPNVLTVADPSDPNGPKKHPEGTTPEARVEVLTGEVLVNKIDNAGNPLPGAAFRLTGNSLTQSIITDASYAANAQGDWYKLDNGTFTQTAPDDSTKSHYVLAADSTADAVKYAKFELVEKTGVLKGERQEVTDVQSVAGSDHVAMFTGLAEGEYVLSETTVPAGFNKLEEDIYFKLKLVKNGDAFDFEMYRGTADDSGKVTYENTASATTSQGGVLSITVVNNAGQRLPSTGGMGTTLFYVVGGALVLAAVVLLITKKRMNG